MILALLACGSSTPADGGTPVGQTLVDWSRGPTTSMSDVRLGSDVGEAATVRKVLVFSPPRTDVLAKDPMATVLHVQATFGQVATDGSAGIPAQVRVPRTVRVDVRASGTWKSAGRCEAGIAVGMPTASEHGEPDYATAPWFASCRLDFTHGPSNAIVMLEIDGDGTLRALGEGAVLGDP